MKIVEKRWYACLLLIVAVCMQAQDREKKIEALLSALTVEEKVSLCSGGFSCFKGIPPIEYTRCRLV